MPRRLPPNVERNHVKGRTYLYFRLGKGRRLRLPDDPNSDEFTKALADCLSGSVKPRQRFEGALPRSIAALVASYKASAAYRGIRGTTKASYSTPLEMFRTKHGRRTVSDKEMTRQRIEKIILDPYAERPGQRLHVLKVLRILIRHAINLGWLKADPSSGIKRPKIGRIRAWTDIELSKFEERWPLGTLQRTAYALMLNMGAARVDVHKITWRQLEDGKAAYARNKTQVPVDAAISRELAAAFDATPRQHVTVINTQHGKPFTVKGFGNFMRAAMTKAGLPLDCKPHGLRKSLGRILAENGATAHEIMAILGHTTLAEAERYTRDASRKLNADRAVVVLNRARNTNGDAQTPVTSLGISEKEKGNQHG